MTSIVPAILAKTRSDFEKRLEQLRPFFYRAQIDVLNNTWLPHSSFADPQIIDTIAKNMTFEIHLMVDVSSYDLSQWNRPWVEKIAFHVETAHELRQYLDAIRSMGKKVFLAINPETSTARIEKYLRNIDGVIFMTVHPGKMGSAFVPEVLEKIHSFHHAHRRIEIQADGGITNETLPSLLSIGVSTCAVGSYFTEEHMEDRVMSLLSIAEAHEARERKAQREKTKS